MHLFATLFAAALLSPAAHAQDRTIDIVIEKNTLNPAKVSVKAGEVFTFKVTNKDKTFEEFESKSMVIEKFIKPGKTLLIKVGPLKPGEYDYFLEFHPEAPKGIVVVTP